jgi:hypothetical protein
MCRNCYERDLRQRNPEFAERQRINCREWSEKNRERKRRVDNEYHRNMPYEQRRAHALMSRFGITLDDYDAMLVKQDGKCAICDVPQGELKRPLYVDHCHLTGIIRGLLCRVCNLGVGFWDKVYPITIHRAEDYLSGKDGYGLQKASYQMGDATGFSKGSYGHNRIHHLRYCFGIDAQDYDILAAKQGNRCAICGKLPLGDGRPLWVDHDHRTGVIRGLLCHKCNTGMGFLDKQPDRLSKVTAYLDGCCGFGMPSRVGKRTSTPFRWGTRKDDYERVRDERDPREGEVLDRGAEE